MILLCESNLLINNKLNLLKNPFKRLKIKCFIKNNWEWQIILPVTGIIICQIVNLIFFPRWIIVNIAYIIMAFALVRATRL